MLASLQISQYRNVRNARLSALATHNLICGPNGSGKTSILESVHILGTARSFRRGTAKTQVTHGEQNYTVHGETRRAGEIRCAVGVQRDLSGDVTLRLRGESARSVASLADELPLVVLNADSFDLLTGEPANRRRFMDWGVFHVEHDLRDHRRQFQRALTQRNHLLRRGKLRPAELEPWTRELAAQGELVSAAREGFLASLEVVFNDLMADLAPEVGEVRLRYRCGWDSSLTYEEALARGEASDRDQGFTQTGPQRGDIRVTVDSYSAADMLSRGQQKLLIAALKLSQGQMLAARGEEVLYLIDDLPAELDALHRERVCRALAAIGAQSMITCVEPEAIPAEWLAGEVAMFHVEHGTVRQG